MACKVCGKENCFEHGGDVKKKPLPPINKYEHVGKSGKSIEQHTDEAFEHFGPEAQELAQKGLKKLKEHHDKKNKFAEGGEILKEMPGEEHEHPDDELNHHVAGELMDALEKKDKKGILESIRAIVMNCGSK